MNVNEISQLVGSVGFPIAASCAMFYLYNKTIKDITTTLAGIDSLLRELTNKLKED